MKEIPLTQGKVAVVDDADYGWLSARKWCFAKCTKAGEGYAAGWNGERVVLMHRVILGAGKGQEIDHINRNKLDNRRENLRVVTRQQQRANTDKPRDNTSGYKGVTPSPSGRRWIAQVRYEGKRHYLGSFGNPADAARAYDEAARKFFGEYARTNF